MSEGTYDKIIYGLVAIGLTALVAWVVLGLYGEAPPEALDAVVTGCIAAIAGMAVPRAQQFPGARTKGDE